MRKLVITLLALALPALGYSVSPTAQATLKPAISPTAMPTPKPLYVDYQPPDWAKGWPHITLEEAEKLHRKHGVLFLDARAKVEYDQGHIPGALPLPTGEADKYYTMYEGEIKKAKTLVTYCHGIGCRLSEKSAKFLVDKGFKNVDVFFGGWPQWNLAKLPIESGDAKAPKSTPVPTPAASAASISPTAVVMPKAMSPSAK